MSQERKPHGITWESYAEQLIRQAQQAGEFDHLQGMGKPIPGLDGYDDEHWWIREKLRREHVSLLPPSLTIRAEVAKALEAIWQLRTTEAVRREVARVNEQIRQANFASQWGPSSTQMPLDADEVVAQWQSRRGCAADGRT
jgi:hypothetical protein